MLAADQPDAAFTLRPRAAANRMKPPLTHQLPQHYLAALRGYLEGGPEESMDAARQFAAAAVASGLDTRDLTRIHEQALAALRLDHRRVRPQDPVPGAQQFFIEVAVALEENHRLAGDPGGDLQQIAKTLERRTLDLAFFRDLLRKQIAARRRAGVNLRTSQRKSRSALKDSLKSQTRLQGALHKILTTSEAERREMSCKLNDEVAQNLLAINLRILSLKKNIAATHKELTLEIHTTQQLVAESATLIGRLAHEITPHEP